MKTYEIILVSLFLIVALYEIGGLIYWIYAKLYNRDKNVPTKADWGGWRKVERYLSLDDEEYYSKLKEASYRAIDIMRKTLSDEEK